MKRKRLLKKLSELLDSKGRKQRKHRDELETLLKKLKRKEIELKERMRLEKDARKQKRQGKELKIVKAQYAKGGKTLQALEKP